MRKPSNQNLNTKARTKKNTKKTLLSKLNLISPKSRMVVTVLAFVIIGGGIMVYKSFAYDRLPLHFASTQYNFDANALPFGANEFEYTVKPLINEHADGIYMSTGYWFKGSSDSKNPENAGGYAGIQNSKCSIPSRSKCVVFSIWRANSGTASIQNSVSQHFSHEGSGWQIIAPYEWIANNSYVIKVRFNGTNSAGEDQWGASIRNASSGRVTNIGTINVPGSWAGIDSAVATFSEVFSSGSSKRTCNNIPYIGVEYKNYVLRSGTTSLSPRSKGIRYTGPGRETSNCVNKTQITPLEGGVKHEMEGSIQNNDTRDYQIDIK